MGRDLAAAYPAARAVFDEVDAALGERLSALVWDGDIAELTLTRERAAGADGDLDRGDAGARGRGGAGDLGGLRRRAFARRVFGALRRGVAVARRHGAAAQAARRGDAGGGPGGRGRDGGAAGARHRRRRGGGGRGGGEGGVCEAANDNDPAQVVVSGNRAAVERAVEIAKGRGAKRALLLPVSAPFHCALMQPAADRMAEALADVAIAAPAVPLVANVKAEAVTDPGEIRRLLVEQVTGRVRWRESVGWMVAQGRRRDRRGRRRQGAERHGPADREGRRDQDGREPRRGAGAGGRRRCST